MLNFYADLDVTICPNQQDPTFTDSDIHILNLDISVHFFHALFTSPWPVLSHTLQHQVGVPVLLLGLLTPQDPNTHGGYLGFKIQFFICICHYDGWDCLKWKRVLTMSLRNAGLWDIVSTELTHRCP